MTGHDLQIFRLLAVAFMVRGRWRWRDGEIVRRVRDLYSEGDPGDSLLALCSADWLTYGPGDVFELTELGRIEARQMVGPLMAGEG